MKAPENKKPLAAFGGPESIARANRFGLELKNLFFLFGEFGFDVGQCVFRVGDMSVEFRIARASDDAEGK
jgi:hypothetical protein